MEQKRNCSLGNNFSRFPQYFQYMSIYKSQITYSFVKCGCPIYFFLNFASLICRGTDTSKYFREFFRLWDNEGRLYYEELAWYAMLVETLLFIRFDLLMFLTSVLLQEQFGKNKGFEIPVWTQYVHNIWKGRLIWGFSKSVYATKL